MLHCGRLRDRLPRLVRLERARHAHLRTGRGSGAGGERAGSERGGVRGEAAGVREAAARREAAGREEAAGRHACLRRVQPLATRLGLDVPRDDFTDLTEGHRLLDLCPCAQRVYDLADPRRATPRVADDKDVARRGARRRWRTCVRLRMTRPSAATTDADAKVALTRINTKLQLSGNRRKSGGRHRASNRIARAGKEFPT